MRPVVRHKTFPWQVLVLTYAVLFLRLSLQASSVGESTRYISQSWQTEDGLPNNSVRAIAQTEDRYLWLATERGLARFDGVRFSIIPPLLAATNHAFTALGRDSAGVLYSATDNAGVFERKNSEISELSLPPEMKNDSISAILAAKDGTLWIGTGTNGLFQLQHGKTTQWTQKDGLAHNAIRALCEDPAGNIWVATATGLSCWRDGKIKTFTVKEGLLHNSTRALCADSSGALWIGSHFGLTRMKDGHFSHFTKNEGLSDNIVSALFADRDGQIWIGTFNGLNRFVDGKILTETHTDGTSYDRVNCIFRDHEDNIWVGTKDGVTRLKPRVLSTLTRQDGLRSNSASSVLEDHDGVTWIGTWGGGASKIEDEGITTYGRKENLSSDFVLTIHQTRRGDMWFGMDYDGGIVLLRTNQFIHYRELEGLRDIAVHAIEDDADGTLWVGTSTALLSFRDGKFQRYSTLNGLTSNSIQAIHQDHAGNLWIGTAGGLCRWTGNMFTNISVQHGPTSPSVTAVNEDSNHTLWIGTSSGLARFRNGKFAFYTSKQGLFSDEIQGAQEDNLGFLWMSCPRGIFRVKKSNFDDFDRGLTKYISCASFDKSDGMLSVECRGSGKTAICKTRDGRLWFPTSKGVVIADPRRVRTNAEPPLVLIEEMFSDKKAVTTDKQNATTVATTLPVGLGELEFHYTSPSLAAPEKLRFRYKLEGFDADWIDAENRRQARYSHVPPGDYRFHVVAVNGDGIWNEQGDSIALTLTPPFWRTAWFSSLIGLIAVGTVLGAVRYVSVKKFKARLKHVEEQHAIERERTRIAQDMHDELGARLTEVLLLNEMTGNKKPENLPKHLDKMSRTVRDVVRNLDAIVWAVNPENDSLEQLVSYIQEYAQLYLETASMRCWFDFPGAIPHCALSSDTRHHFFSTVKEALNNIVKHSGASEVWLSLKHSNNTFFFTIRDNGHGFSSETVSNSGNGLKNMRKRIEALNGTIALQSELGKGTQICIQFPLHIPVPSL